MVFYLTSPVQTYNLPYSLYSIRVQIKENFVKKILIPLLFVASAASMLGQGPTYSVTTLAPAGTGKLDESKAASTLFLPSAVALDGSGNVYFADTNSNRIKKIDAQTLQISVVAGTGVAGNTGDGAAGTRATLNGPTGLVFDGAGSLLIADTGSHRIRKLNLSTGIITLVAGTTAGFSGDGGLATAARLNSPANLFIDKSGNLYIADRVNNRIRRLEKDGKIYTVAGSSGAGDFAGDDGPALQAKLNAPRGVAVDADYNVYISDTGNNSIRKVTVKRDSNGRPIDSAGVITTVVGAPVRNVVTNVVTRSTAVVDGGPGTNSGIHSPRGMAFDSTGKLYIASQGKDRIRVFDPATGTISAFPCIVNRTANLTCGMDDPESLAFDADGGIWVAESANNRISRIGTDRTLVVYAGIPFGVLSNNPRGVTVDPAGRVVVTDTGKHMIRRIEADGTLTTLAGTGVSGFSGDTNNTTFGPVQAPAAPAVNAALNNPWGGAFDAAGNFFFADRSNRRIRKIDTAGNISSIAGSTIRLSNVDPVTLKAGTANVTQGYNGDGKLGTLGQLNNPDAVAVDNLGNVYVAEETNHVIRRIDPNGIMSTFAGLAPDCAAFAPLYTNVSDDPIGIGGTADTGTGPSCVGVSGTTGDGSVASQNPLNSPRGVAVDLNGNVYISETGNNAIRVVGTDGIISTIGGTLNTPLGIAVDSDGAVYVANSAANNIVRIDPKTKANTVIAGGGTDFADGPDATKTRFQSPFAVGVDAAKNVYVTDQTGRVRKLTLGK